MPYRYGMSEKQTDLQVDGWGGPLIIALQDGLPEQRHVLASIAATCTARHTLLLAAWARRV